MYHFYIEFQFIDLIITYSDYFIFYGNFRFYFCEFAIKHMYVETSIQNIMNDNDMVE